VSISIHGTLTVDCSTACGCRSWLMHTKCSCHTNVCIPDPLDMLALHLALNNTLSGPARAAGTHASKLQGPWMVQMVDDSPDSVLAETCPSKRLLDTHMPSCSGWMTQPMPRHTGNWGQPPAAPQVGYPAPCTHSPPSTCEGNGCLPAQLSWAGCTWVNASVQIHSRRGTVMLTVQC
jgi:hypothetical protein